MVKLLTCRARAQDSNPGLITMISKTYYLLLTSHDMTNIMFKLCKILNQPKPKLGSLLYNVTSSNIS